MALNNKSKPCGALVGEKFGKLTVLNEEVIFKSGKNRIFTTCECECGGKKTCERYGLVSGSTTSCGCVRKETTIAFNKTKKKEPGTRKKQMIEDIKCFIMLNTGQRKKEYPLQFLWMIL
jgi:hypothetical protein